MKNTTTYKYRARLPEIQAILFEGTFDSVLNVLNFIKNQTLEEELKPLMINIEALAGDDNFDVTIEFSYSKLYLEKDEYLIFREKGCEFHINHSKDFKATYTKA